jgi:hypothetical protein
MKPQVVETSEDGCFAYVTFEEVFSNGYMKNRLYIYNVTNDSNPLHVMTWTSAGTTANFDQFEPTISVQQPGGGNKPTGWFWYSDIHTACSLQYEGAVDAAGGFSNLSSTGPISSRFPEYLDGVGKSNTGDYSMAFVEGSPFSPSSRIRVNARRATPRTHDRARA